MIPTYNPRTQEDDGQTQGNHEIHMNTKTSQKRELANINNKKTQF